MSVCQPVKVNDSDISHCLKHQGKLALTLTSLRLDSPRWDIGNWSNTSLSCTLFLAASGDTKLHVALWRRGPRAKCSRTNYVRVRDHGHVFNSTDCEGNFSLYKSSTYSMEIAIVVGDPRTLLSISIGVQAASATFETKHITSDMGFIETQTPTSKYSRFTDSWVSLSPPMGHVTLISVQRLVHHSRNSYNFEESFVQLYQGGNTAKHRVWKSSQTGSVPSPQSYDTRIMYLRFTGKLKYLWVQLLYSFHSKTHPLSLVDGGLWNCSVAQWPEIQRHFLCNLEEECGGGEDERQCHYSGRCGQGHLTLGNRCYLYLHGQSMSWRDSNLECQRRGGYLASLNTPDEMKKVQDVLKMRRSNKFVFCGLQPVSFIYPSMYRDTSMWADSTVSYYKYYKSRKQNHCGYFNSYRTHQIIKCDEKIRSVQFVCELDTPSRQLEEDAQEVSAETQPDVRMSLPRNASFSVPTAKCPAGHLTHVFLACDVQSACWSSHRDYVDSGTRGIPPAASCPAPMTSLPAMFTCDSGLQRVPYSLVCDHRQQCDDDSDESFCVFLPCSGSTPLKCPTSSQCASLSAWCNGQDDCKQKADEAQCIFYYTETRPPPAIVDFQLRDSSSTLGSTYFMTPFVTRCPETHFQCKNNGYCLPVFVKCNAVSDCPGSEDEAGCQDASCPGFYRCRSSGVCLHPTHVCDGRYQCPQHDDELVCYQSCPTGCTCHGLAFTCYQTFSAELHLEMRYLDASGSGLTSALLKENSLLIHLSLSKCGLESLGNMTFPNLRSLDFSYNNVFSICASHLRGMLNLQYLSLSNNPLKSPFRSDSERHPFPAVRTLDLSGVTMKTLNTLSLSPFSGLQTLNLSDCGVDFIVGQGFHATSKLRDLDITGCPMSRFPRDLLSGLGELRSVEADNFKLCCAATLPTSFNAANCRAPFDEVSSCESLLRANIYVVFLSIFCALSLLGNLCCLLNRCASSKSGVSGFGVFVTYLSISDFLMGVYLAVIGVADRLYKGSYLWQDTAWRHSTACEAAGFLSLLSSEVSAIIICLITLDRFLVLRFPFSTVHFKARSARVTCAVVWIIVISMAALPLTPMASHWSFYSQTGICIPLPVTRRIFPGRYYAFGVLIVLNFILFLLIAAGQASVYISVRANSLSTTNSTKKSNDLRIARRLITVAVSDFLCWFPIGLLGLLASRGVPVPGEINVGLAILVLPLNSALNPFLYTINVMLERRRRSQDEKMMKYLWQEIEWDVSST